MSTTDPSTLAGPATPAAPRRKFFAKKSEWARERARELQVRALELKYEPTTSSRRAARKYDCVRNLEAEAAKFDRIARNLEEKGQ